MSFHLYMYSIPSQGVLQLRVPNPMGEPRPVAAIRESAFASPFRTDGQITTFTPVVNGSPLQFACKRLASRHVINPVRSWETQVEHVYDISSLISVLRLRGFSIDGKSPEYFKADVRPSILSITTAEPIGSL
jgi:hypothetical protein